MPDAHKILRTIRNIAFLCGILATLQFTTPATANAQTITTCEPTAFVATRLVSTINRYLNCWWNREFKGAMEDWTENISIQILEHSRILGTFIDAQNTNKALMTLQSEMLEAGRRYRPSDLGCIAGTGAMGLTRANMATHAMTVAIEADFAANSTNVLGSPGDQGSSSFLMHAWEEYEDEFCDPFMNIARPGPNCSAGTWRNADILVGPTLIGNETISDKDELRAAMALIRNLMMRNIPEPFPERVLEGHDGKETYLERRAALAKRMIAIHEAAESVGRRMPGTKTGPWLKAMLDQAGVPDGSFTVSGRTQSHVAPNPSYHEMMGAMTKTRFGDPEYFVRLSEDPEMAARDRVSNMAYKLMMLRERYEMLEQFALILALQVNARYGD